MKFVFALLLACMCAQASHQGPQEAPYQDYGPLLLLRQVEWIPFEEPFFNDVRPLYENASPAQKYALSHEKLFYVQSAVHLGVPLAQLIPILDQEKYPEMGSSFIHAFVKLFINVHAPNLDPSSSKFW